MNKQDNTNSANPTPAIVATSDNDHTGPAIDAVKTVASISVAAN